MEDRDSLPRGQANQQVGPTRFIERILPSKTSRIEPLNRSSRRKEALTSIPGRRVSLLTSAATSFMGRVGYCQIYLREMADEYSVSPRGWRGFAPPGSQFAPCFKRP